MENNKKALLETFESFICSTCNQQTRLKKIGDLSNCVYSCNHCGSLYKLIDKMPKRLTSMDFNSWWCDR